VDFSKAFDCVPREMLWRRLRALRVPDDFVTAIRDYYASVHLRVRGPAGYSDWFESTAGVKQGCPLSPTLFGLYIDHLEEFWAMKQKSSLSDRRPRLLLYADDIVLLGYSAAELQSLLNLLDEFCTQVGLRVNRNKTQVVIFRSGEALPAGTSSTFTYAGGKLEVVDEYRYLGFVMHAWLSPGEHGFKILLRSAEGAAHRLRSRLFALGIRDLPTICRLFDSYVRPILFYACETWFPFVPALTDLFTSPIEQLHHRFLRAALRLPASVATAPLLWETGRTPLFAYLVRQVARFYQRTAYRAREAPQAS
jgi:hypothetical protein